MIVGLIGKKRAGKDSFAARLVERHGFTRFAFADPLKAVMLELNPFLGGTVRLSEFVELKGWEWAKERPEVRRLLQVHGTAIRKHVDPYVWVHATMRKVHQTPGPVVVTDVRFKNEAEEIRAAGGVLVRIVRDLGEDSSAAAKHVSETELNDYPTGYRISNNGPLPVLHARADSLVYELTHVRPPHSRTAQLQLF